MVQAGAEDELVRKLKIRFYVARAEAGHTTQNTQRAERSMCTVSAERALCTVKVKVVHQYELRKTASIVVALRKFNGTCGN